MIVKNRNKTTKPILILRDRIELPTQCYGIVFNKALIFESDSSDSYEEVSCKLMKNGKTVIFDPADNLNEKYAVVSYLSG